MKRRFVAAFKPHMKGFAKIFGTLEADIIELIWELRELSGREVFEALRDQGQRLSYGAVRTVLDRLVKKQLIEREMRNGQYFYTATRTREQFTHTAVSEILTSLIDSFGEPVYAQFVKHVGTADPAQLERLAQLIHEAEQRAKTETNE